MQIRPIRLGRRGAAAGPSYGGVQTARLPEKYYWWNNMLQINGFAVSTKKIQKLLGLEIVEELNIPI